MCVKHAMSCCISVVFCSCVTDADLAYQGQYVFLFYISMSVDVRIESMSLIQDLKDSN